MKKYRILIDSITIDLKANTEEEAIEKAHYHQNTDHTYIGWEIE